MPGLPIASIFVQACHRAPPPRPANQASEWSLRPPQQPVKAPPNIGDQRHRLNADSVSRRLVAMDTRIDPPGNRVLQHRAEHEHLASQFLDRCRETDPKSPLRDINSEPSSERPRICPIRVAHPVYGGALNTSHGHPGPCRQTPFAIARTPGVNGGITGGIIRFFQAVTTALEPSKNVFWRS